MQKWGRDGRDGIRPASAIALAGHDRYCYVVLGPKEYLVLQILAQHAGKVVTRQEIMKQVWGGPHLDARVPGFWATCPTNPDLWDL